MKNDASPSDLTTMKPCHMPPHKQTDMPDASKTESDVTAAFNFGRFIATGASSHSDYARSILEALVAVGKGTTPHSSFGDPQKLARICQEIGVDTVESTPEEQAIALAEIFHKDEEASNITFPFLRRVPHVRHTIWEQNRSMPRYASQEGLEMLDHTSMGGDYDSISMCLHAGQVALGDGWDSSMIATEVADILFGTPSAKTSSISFDMLQKDHINILVHSQNPIVFETMYAAAHDPEMENKAVASGALGVNIVDCRHLESESLESQVNPTIDTALRMELSIATGAVDMLLVDDLCSVPRLLTGAHCHNTLCASISDTTCASGVTCLEFTPQDAHTTACTAICAAIDAFSKRRAIIVDIPSAPVQLMTGFSQEALLNACGGTPDMLIKALEIGHIRGIVAIMCCHNPASQHNQAHIQLAHELVQRDILVVVTGCATTSMGESGLMDVDTLDHVGQGLATVCQSLDFPPVLHMGSCMDTARFLHLSAILANHANCDTGELPIAVSAPEWYTEKSLSIGLSCVASGIYTHLGVPSSFLEGKRPTDSMVSELEEIYGASFAVEFDPIKAADIIEEQIHHKRLALGWHDRYSGEIFS
ncbi:hypothetical protein [Desulfovibrio inopinatus]|uniref:hypothetical protein n=1 Tax=Desulfovibrio inopinatus TaxID=102109 RepID=UPI00040BB023|nr:hypothetical protein [Desulfovibrio inopinatus]